MLDVLFDEVADVQSLVKRESLELRPRLEPWLGRAKRLQRHEVYMDGGASFREFWDQGDTLLGELEAIVPGHVRTLRV